MVIAITFIFLLISVRVFYVQIVDGARLQSLAVDQWTRELPIIAGRGTIVDANGTPLVVNDSSFAVYIRPRNVIDREKVASVLSDICEVDKEKLLNKIKSDSSSEITVKRAVSKETIDKISEYELDGVYFSSDNKRYYPYGDSLCQILGYTSVDGSGLTGLEKRYDEYLRGYNGEILYDADLIGKDLENSAVRYVKATDGLNVKLNVDYEIQQICDGVTAKAMNEYSPKSVAVIVMDPSDGKLLAVSQRPCFNLNEIPRNDAEKLNKESRSGVFSDSYEPGSTFKILTAAADINEYLKGNSRAFSLSYIFNSSRYRYVGGRKIKCWSSHDNGKHSNETLADALNNSCNPCFVDIALSLGKKTMYDYVKAFGYGKVTGVDFDGEALGMVVPESAVTEGDLARISFGQTIAVTPIQLLCATAAAVNGGLYFEPYLVSEIYDADGNIAEIINPKLRGRVISEEASAILASYLEGVVSSGSGKQAYIEGYKVGGKTGTAQKYENGIIAVGKYIMSFIGFFPADKPRYMALCVVDEPVGGLYGSTVAAPLVKEVFEGIIKVKNIKSAV